MGEVTKRDASLLHRSLPSNGFGRVKFYGCCNHIGLSLLLLKPLEVKDNKKTQWSLQSENDVDRNRL